MSAVSVLKEGAIVACGPGARTKTVVVVRTPEWAAANGLRFPSSLIVQRSGWFVGETYTGLRYFGRLVLKLSDDSVRTVRRFGLDCPEVVLYSVDTVAIEDEEDETFTLWGVLGEPMVRLGVLFTRPENVAEAFR